jgi:hypothetical protein
VGVAQLVERLVVVQVVAGSSPVTHPTRFQRVRHCSKITGKLGDACIWLSDSPTDHVARATRMPAFMRSYVAWIAASQPPMMTRPPSSSMRMVIPAALRAWTVDSRAPPRGPKRIRSAR